MSRRTRGALSRPIDSHLGLQVRARRKALGLSLESLAAELGVAYQQVQKYESGVNRISASTLWDIAGVLRTPVAYFYTGLDGPVGETNGLGGMLATADGCDLANAFLTLPPRLRSALTVLAREVADEIPAD